MALLSTYQLSIGYRLASGSICLQQGIDFSLKTGEIVSLMGQNGVGKTTFLKTISGLLAPLDGEINFGQDRVENLEPEELSKRLSVVLTDKPATMNLTVLELISLGRQPYLSWLGMLKTSDKQAIQRAIDDTRINYIAHKKLYQLSDGQLQKAMIARALAQETDIILLDEPASHLDLHNKIEIMLLLQEIAKQGKGVIISTHDMHLSTQLSDRLWLFNFNKPVQQGLPEDLIISGKLEETLFLTGMGYNMVTNTIESTAATKPLDLTGEGTYRHWTLQALRRNGFHHQSGAKNKIEIRDQQWVLNQTEKANSIESLLGLIKKLSSESW